MEYGTLKAYEDRVVVVMTTSTGLFRPKQGQLVVEYPYAEIAQVEMQPSTGGRDERCVALCFRRFPRMSGVHQRRGSPFIR